jgi:hypothetical protein
MQENVMGADPTPPTLPAVPTWRLRPPLRRIVVRFAETVCPPQVRTGHVMGGLLTEFESLLGALPAGMRWLIPSGLVAFDQCARFYPRAHGRRFVTLRDADADAYCRAVLGMRRRAPATAVQRIKGLVVMCYFEVPDVKEQLGYRPDSYIAEVSLRRLSSYGPQIRAGEAAALGPDPDSPDQMASPRPPRQGS